jgi:cathepsin L
VALNNKISYLMNKSLTILALTALLVGAVYISTQSNKDTAFEEWKAQYGANWAASEEEYRRIVFARNVEKINKHNADKTQTYTMGINQFTAMTQEEFVNTYLDPKPEVAAPVETEHPIVGDVDWTTQGKVSPVKNQGQCGSCWAFSTTGVLESWSLIKGQSVSLSEQQLVDCSRSYGNQGCQGGWPSSALNYVKDHGITTESAYPYVGQNKACGTNGGSFKISSYASYSGCNGLSSAINGKPISVTVDATNWSPYKSGIFNNCGASINHAVLLVGVVGGAWKIKNSWGTGWGEQGFIRLASGNTCGVCAYAGVAPN